MNVKVKSGSPSGCTSSNGCWLRKHIPLLGQTHNLSTHCPLQHTSFSSLMCLLAIVQTRVPAKSRFGLCSAWAGCVWLIRVSTQPGGYICISFLLLWLQIAGKVTTTGKPRSQSCGHWILRYKKARKTSVCRERGSVFMFWVHQFVIESLRGSTRRTVKLPVWLTAAKQVFNAAGLISTLCFPSSRCHFFCLSVKGKEAWVGERRELAEAASGSILSVGRLTSGILERPVSE